MKKQIPQIINMKYHLSKKEIKELRDSKKRITKYSLNEFKKKLPQIKYSNPQPLTYYFADLEGDKEAFKLLENVGRKVMTKQEYILIGFNHIVANAKNNKFELTSLNKKLKSKKR